jgi:hypothetical protein
VGKIYEKVKRRKRIKGKSVRRKRKKRKKRRKLELLFSSIYLRWGHQFDRVSRGVQETNVLLLIFFSPFTKE